DWIRRSEERFKHQLQEAAHRNLKPTPLFDNEGEATVTFPCHWLHEDRTFPIGTRLTIFQRGDKARIAVMEGSVAIAEVRGEAARDIHDLFRLHPEMQNCLPVSISDVRQSTEPFYVQRVWPKAKTRGKVQ
ncbi:MAG: hypothetical protein WA634_13860, partial [Silvibacterium sp.]